jgi:hypothetical protein
LANHPGEMPQGKEGGLAGGGADVEGLSEEQAHAKEIEV